MNMAGVIKVMIVDDHPLVRRGMSTVINQQVDMKVVAESDGGQQVQELFRQHRPDVVIMDMRLEGDNGARLTAAILGEFPPAKVLVISNYEGDEDIRQATSAGARGYLFKSIVEDELIDAIRDVHEGHTYFPKRVAARLEEQVRLTGREEEMAQLLAKGLNNREIAQVLGIAADTVKTHLKGLFRKLGVSSRAEAVHEAMQRGFLRE